VKDFVSIKGFSRIMIGRREDGKLIIDGDSGLVGPNQVVNLGFQDYICAAIGAVAGSKQVSYMQLGTGTEPGAAATSLQGETGARKTTNNSVVSSKTLRITAAWASGDHPGGTPALKNVGLFNTSAAGTLACGNTYGTSSWQSNQGVSATYELQFS
jgi:hypothetical protein